MQSDHLPTSSQNTDYQHNKYLNKKANQ